jgi:Tfp pilus assembly pilus retraction ATPase PilT
MRTLERSLAELVSQGKIARHEAERAANKPASFEDEMKRLT